MTHAALKDLENKWRDEAMDYEPGPDSTGPDRDLLRRCDELSAALSAMEGEAVPVGYLFRPRDGSPWQFEEGNEIPQIVTDHLETLPVYTAPPPQQAAERAQDGVQGELVAIMDDAGRVPLWADGRLPLEPGARLYLSRPWPKGPQDNPMRFPADPRALATQPQQAGGEVVVTTDESGRCVMVSRQDEEHRILKVLWEVSTHPQPEAGGGEAAAHVPDTILTPAIKAFNAKRREASEALKGQPAEGKKSAIEAIAIEAAILAALSTTPASGGEHG